LSYMPRVRDVFNMLIVEVSKLVAKGIGHGELFLHFFDLERLCARYTSTDDFVWLFYNSWVTPLSLCEGIKPSYFSDEFLKMRIVDEVAKKFYSLVVEYSRIILYCLSHIDEYFAYLRALLEEGCRSIRSEEVLRRRSLLRVLDVAPFKFTLGDEYEIGLFDFLEFRMGSHLVNMTIGHELELEHKVVLAHSIYSGDFLDHYAKHLCISTEDRLRLYLCYAKLMDLVKRSLSRGTLAQLETKF